LFRRFCWLFRRFCWLFRRFCWLFRRFCWLFRRFAGCFVDFAGCFVDFAGCFLPPAFSFPLCLVSTFNCVDLLFAGGATCTLHIEDSLSGSGMEKGRLRAPFTNLSSSLLILFPLYRVQTKSVKDCTCTKAIGIHLTIGVH